MGVPVSAQAVANALIRLAAEEKRPLTNMQLQKLVFLGQGYCLALLGSPLYFNNTHAWQWGPVVPKLYKELQKYGSAQVTEEIPAEDVLSADSKEYGIIQAVWNAYRKFTGSQLSQLTHLPGSPWAKTWETSKFGVIPIEAIQTYYRDRLAARK